MSLPPEEIAFQKSRINESRQNEIITVNMVLIALAAFAVVLRLWSRKLCGLRWLWDDYLIIAALFFATGLAFHSIPGRQMHADVR